MSQLLEPDQEQKLALLYPPFADLIRNLIHSARSQGMSVAVFEALRTFERQQQLYQQGRDATGKIVDRKRIVTNSPAGMSWHQYGLASDIIFFDAKNFSTFGKYLWSWDSKNPWKEMADLSKSMGLEPAYYWKRFPESPHHQKTYGLQLHAALALYHEGGLPMVWKECV